GRDHRDPGEQPGQAGAGDLVEQVGLVEGHQLGHVGGAALPEDGGGGGRRPGRAPLLRARGSGASAAPTSPRTERTAAICPAGSGWAASTRWTIRSARATSSRGDLNASTRSWGSLAR